MASANDAYRLRWAETRALLTQLTVHHFRNLQELVWCPEPGSHLLLGNNGAGKTSVLEAVYAVATTRSFRSPRIEDCVCMTGMDPSVEDPADPRSLQRLSGLEGPESQPGFRLQAEIAQAQRVCLELGWRGGSGWRSVNGSQTSLAEYLKNLPVVAWTQSEGEVFMGPPETRRRFLDRGVVARRPHSLAVIARYRKALRSKRELLRRRQKGIESWNGVLARAAAELIELRAAYVEDLARHLSEVLAASGLGFPVVQLVYEPSPSTARNGIAAIEEALDGARARERQLGRPLLGPHRDRLRFLWSGRDLHRVASAGERKSVGLLLLAAQGQVLFRAGRSPVYLLDDADSELDGRALAALWPVLGSGDQVFASSNRPGVWQGLGIGYRWQMERGFVRVHT